MPIDSREILKINYKTIKTTVISMIFYSQYIF